MRILLILMMSVFIIGCLGTPKGVQPVADFELDRYLGEWYEIARLDHKFERGLQNVSAEYTMRDDGGVRVLNRGFSSEKNKWKQAEGKAFFIKNRDEGHLKVSFFGPFYGSYVIFELDSADYQYAYVAGNTTSYLWLLSRTPTVSQERLDDFIQRSKALGFDTEKLIFVEQN